MHGQCWGTVDGPTPTAISCTSPNVCCLCWLRQRPFPNSPSFSSGSFPHCPHPLTFPPFLRTFSNVPLSHQHVSQPPALQGQPACKYTFIAVGLCSVHTTWPEQQALPCSAGARVSFGLARRAPVEHRDPELGKATWPTLVLVHGSLGHRRGSSGGWVQQRSWGKHGCETVWYFILSAIFSMTGF